MENPTILNACDRSPLMPDPRPRIAITLGDPAGIGPEVVMKAVTQKKWSANLTVIGDGVTWQRALQTVAKSGTGEIAQTAAEIPLRAPAMAGFDPAAVVWGEPTPATGRASFAWLDAAIAGALAGRYDAVVTAPIAKSAWHAAGHHYPGQTEVLAERAGVERFGMGFAARSPHTGWNLVCLLATTHIPLSQVPTTLTPDLLTRKLDLLVEWLRRDFGWATPRLAIAGLNPHSGESGQMGREEQDMLIPWLLAQRSRYPEITLAGPVPPDTLWVSAGQAWYRDAITSPYDAYLALYHDQGLIPVKLLAFDRAVNTTIGLPFVRTSPDHGTAFDIAGQGVAQADSMVAAIALAIEAVQQQRRDRAAPTGAGAESSRS